MAVITIDGLRLEVPDGKNVLDCALDGGIYIPHLCHHKDLTPLGSCRMCIVEVEGEEKPVPSCKLKARDGLVIHTQTEEVKRLRMLALELLLAGHPEDCSTCPKYGNCELQMLIQYIGPKTGRLKLRAKGFSQDDRNPMIIHDMNRCVLCGRCVRACNDMRGVGVLQYQKKDLEVYTGALHQKLLKDADCRFCQACVEVCPTGTIRDKLANSEVRKEDYVVPCRHGCPAHIDVPRYIRFISQGDYAAANATVREKVPFPHSLGYICVHSCELECKHQYLNEAVSIRNLKRFAAEHDDGEWKKKAFHKPATGKKIAVVGGGPSGLTAAYFGAKLGHEVTIFESSAKLGGQLRYGIPSYRLPRETLDHEIADILEAGDITVKTETKVENVPNLLKEGFDAVYVAVGTHQGARLPLPGSDLEGVMVNTDFLRAFEEGTASVGEHVVILGGGNVAIDCAGAAFRLGAKTVDMACLEAYDAMTATDEERSWAEEEGVVLHNSKTFPQILGENGHCTSVEIQSVGNFRKENGRMVFDKLEGTNEILTADTVVFATGQRPTIPMDPEVFGLELIHGNYIASCGENGETSVEGIWAGGDSMTGTTSVIRGIEGARKAIIAIDRYLGGDGNIEENLAPKQVKDPYIGKIEGFADEKRTMPRVVPAPERVKNWKTCGPMDQGFDEKLARCEAGRCLQCDLRLCISRPQTWGDFAKEAEV